MSLLAFLLVGILLLYIVHVLDNAYTALALAKGVAHKRLPPGLYLVVIILIALTGWWSMRTPSSPAEKGTTSIVTSSGTKEDSLWHAPDTARWSELPNASQLRYGRALIANTASYLGPHGSVAPLTNGMNCQNCHLDAGTKPFGNNYSAVFSTYPKFRERSGSVESISKRVNDCMERSLNGQALDTNSREMQAILAYIAWLGSDVQKGTKPKGSGLQELAFLERAADPSRGLAVYTGKCQSCHGTEGQGMPNPAGNGFTYPPLWGPQSYNVGAGLYRLSRFAGYVHANMPWGVRHDSPQLTEEEAWDVAAFVNSQPRPQKDLSKDWPNISGKPIDHPFGPYSDGFSESQHKFGPFGPIRKAREAQQAKKEKPLASR